MAAVLLVEHDPAVAELSRRYLARDGFTIRLARSPAEAAAALADTAAGGYSPDAVVLDLTMPGLAAGEIRRALYQTAGTPGAAAEPAAEPGGVGQAAGTPGGQGTGRRQRGRPEPARPLVCLAGPGGLRPQEVGAGESSCLNRPFGPRSLVASVRMTLAAAAPAGSGDAASSRGTGGTGAGLPAAAGAGQVMQGFADVALTATERELLAFLVANPGRVFTRERLLTALRGTAEEGTTGPGAHRKGPDGRGTGRPGRRSSPAGPRAVDVYVAQLRAKLGDRSPIRTVRGVGYAARP